MLNILAHADEAVRDYALSSPEVSVNWLGIALAVIVAMAIGTLWYGPVFGKKWMKLVGLKKGASSPVGPMLIMLGLCVIQAFVLAHFIIYVSYFYTGYSDLSVGLLTGAWTFVGFVAPVLISNAVFAKGSMDLLKINLGNQLITLLAIGAILATVN